jgi:hypothetical protein
MALRTHNLPSGRLEMRVCEVDEGIFECDERPCEIIFCFLGIQKSELVEVAEVLFQVGGWLEN